MTQNMTESVGYYTDAACTAIRQKNTLRLIMFLVHKESPPLSSGNILLIESWLSTIRAPASIQL